MITSAGQFLGQRLRRRWQRWADAVAPPPLILMYHRIAAAAVDPWQLCVSPPRFAAQMQWLRRHRRPMRLQELTQELERGRCPRGAVVVTFDDGYRDNLTAALPVLEACEVPATVFCTADALGRGAPFWWDRLAGLLLGAGPLPPTLTLDAAGRQARFELQAAQRYEEEARASDRRRRGDDDACSPRLAFYRAVWAWLRPLPAAERALAVDQVARWCAAAGSLPAEVALPLSHDEARTLAASPWVEIGAHTLTHPALSTLSADQQRAEIAHGKAQLEALVARPVTSFAYPFGDQAADTAALVREAGFQAACTTDAAALRPRTDPYQLPRVAIGDWDADACARALRSVA